MNNQTCSSVVSICADSAYEKISYLVANGMKVLPACRQIAEEFNNENPTAKVEVESLRKMYNRTIKTTKTVSVTQKTGTMTQKSKKKAPTKKELLEQLKAKDAQIIELSEQFQALNDGHVENPEQNQVVKEQSQLNQALNDGQDKKDEQNQVVKSSEKEENMLKANLSLNRQLEHYERDNLRMREEIHELAQKLHNVEKERDAIMDASNQQYLECKEMEEHLRREIKKNQDIISLYDEITEKFLIKYTPEMQSDLRKKIEKQFNDLLKVQK